MIKLSALVISLFALLLAAGCEVPLEEAVIGRYRGELDITSVDKEDRERMIRAATAFKNSFVEIKKGGKAKFDAMIFRGEAGWKLEGTTLTITPKGAEEGLSFTVANGAAKLTPIFSDAQAAYFRGAKPWFKKE